jgi:hydrogenase maturation protease
VKTILVGLGNTVLSDDGVGIYTARAVREQLGGIDVEIIEAELAGLDIMEKLKGYDRAIIVDAIQLDGEEPGTVFRIRPDDIRVTPRIASFHDVDLVTALELGKRLGFHMPSEVVIFAVQAEDVLTLEEGCVPAVARVIPALADEIAGEITGRRHETISRRLPARRSGNA